MQGVDIALECYVGNLLVEETFNIGGFDLADFEDEGPPTGWKEVIGTVDLGNNVTVQAGSDAPNTECSTVRTAKRSLQ